MKSNRVEAHIIAQQGGEPLSPKQKDALILAGLDAEGSAKKRGKKIYKGYHQRMKADD